MIPLPIPMKLLLALVLTSLLASCDSSVGTSSNANLNTGDGSYKGPAARTADIRSFQLNFWEFLRQDNRCGQCHGVGQVPVFVDQTDVNKAYSQAINYANLQDPASSEFVSKVGAGHQCWLGAPSACASTIERMISNWATDSNVTTSRLISLSPPTLRDPGDAKSFPPDATTPGMNGRSFADTVYPLLIGTVPAIANNNCQNCHEESGPLLPQAPFFGSPDVDSAYAAARSKMNIDTPANSRFVQRLEQQHNCWTNCPDDAISMTDVISLFAEGIAETEIDITLITSKALGFADGIVASGGSRHESNLVALWEFKTGEQLTAYDTSGIDPAVNLAMISDASGSVTWLEGYGLDFRGGRAQALTFDSEKLHTFIQSTGEYSVEAWVVPANVTQQDTNIVSYSGSDTARNFTLGQNMYNYDFYNRVVATPARPNGDPFLSTETSGEELVTANLQHVVANYDPIEGRSLYVNGELVNATDPVPGATTINNVWDDGFTLILGNETSGARPWEGHMRMLAIHNRTLTPAQVQQNFDVGVGEKYFLLFYVGHRIGIPQSYIMFEVSQFDNYSYLFNRPTFINLDPNWSPVAVAIEGMRIGINGKEALTGQVYANLNTTAGGNYDPQLGELLSPLGTIISLEKGSGSDEFFLTFERIGTETRTYTEALPNIPSDPADPANAVESDIGVRTFEEINATIAGITGVSVNNSEVRRVYDNYMQQLPSTETIDAFLPSHQMAIAQLALASCSELVNADMAAPSYFAGFNFSEPAQSAFDDPAERDAIILPLLQAVMNVDAGLPSNNLTSQPLQSEISDLLGSPAPQSLEGEPYDSLITQMLSDNVDTAARTVQIAKAVCAVAVGGAVMLVQ